MSQSYYRQVLYDVEWQRIRVSLLGSWGAVPGAVTSLMAVEQYVNKPGISDYGNRIWRALNMLNAVLLSYRGGNTHACWGIIQKARDFYSQEHVRTPMEVGFETPDYKIWSWDKVREELKSVPAEDIKAVRQNMLHRQSAAKYYKRKRMSSAPIDVTRPELHQFITLLEDELRSR